MTDKGDVRSERIWRCACHYSPHFVAVVADPIASDVAENPDVGAWVTVEVTNGPVPIWSRAKEAWALLRGRGHRYCYAEVMLEPKTAREIRDHLSRFLND